MIQKKVSEKTDNATIGFASRYRPFSNLHPANIEIEGATYPSTEPFYQYRKCLSTGDHEAAAEVLLAQEPEDAMAAGSRVRQTEHWYKKEGKQIMKVAVRAKFSKDFLRKKLIATGLSVLVESTRNTVWGTGIPFTSNDALNPKAFFGQNLQGVVLMEVRQELATAKHNHPTTQTSPGSKSHRAGPVFEQI